MKTIKALSESIKVSKVSIYKAINSKLKDELKGHIFKDEKKVTLVDEIGQALLIDYFSREKEETLIDLAEDIRQEEVEILISSKADSKQDSNVGEKVKSPDIINLLKEQIKTKDDQINSLLNIVTNQQKLQMTELITDNSNIISNNSDAQTEPSSKKSFFDKIFKR